MSLWSDTERAVARALRPHGIQIANAMRRAVVRLVNDTPLLQTLQLFVTGTGEGEDDEVESDVEHFEHYGLTTWIPTGGEVILLRLGGEREVQAAIASAYRSVRPNLTAEGDVTIWDKDGQAVRLERTKIVIELKAGNTLELGVGATKGVARTGDAVYTDIAIDPVFVAWMNAVDAALVGAPVPPVNPGSVTSKITGGSATVKAVD